MLSKKRGDNTIVIPSCKLWRDRYFKNIFDSPQQMPPKTKQLMPIIKSPSLSLTKATPKQAPVEPQPNQCRISKPQFKETHSLEIEGFWCVVNMALPPESFVYRGFGGVLITYLLHLICAKSEEIRI